MKKSLSSKLLSGFLMGLLFVPASYSLMIISLYDAVIYDIDFTAQSTTLVPTSPYSAPTSPMGNSKVEMFISAQVGELEKKIKEVDDFLSNADSFIKLMSDMRSSNPMAMGTIPKLRKAVENSQLPDTDKTRHLAALDDAERLCGEASGHALTSKTHASEAKKDFMAAIALVKAKDRNYVDKIKSGNDKQKTAMNIKDLANASCNGAKAKIMGVEKALANIGIIP